MGRDTGSPGWVAESTLFTGGSALMYVVIGLMGTIIGVLGGIVGYFIDAMFLNLHAAVWLFLVSWAASTSYLSYRRVPSGALAVGLYFVGLLVVLQPVAIYGPLLVAASDASASAGSRLLIESWQGIFRWGGIAGVLAVAITFVSRLLKRHADRALRRRRKRNLWNEHED